MDVSEGREEYLLRLLRDFRDCMAEVEQTCRAYVSHSSEGPDARHAMDQCARVLKERNVRQLIGEADQLFDAPETPPWTD